MNGPAAGSALTSEEAERDQLFRFSADFVVKVFWSCAAEASREHDSHSGQLADRDSPQKGRRETRFYPSCTLSVVGSHFATKSASFRMRIPIRAGANSRARPPGSQPRRARASP